MKHIACRLAVLLLSLSLTRLPICAATSHTEEKTIDLASDTLWQASADGGAFRPIAVPGGGWNSDRQPAPRMRPLTRHEEPDEANLKGDPRGSSRVNPEMTKYNQNQPDRPVVVMDHVSYQRDLVIPAEWAGRSIQLEFGAVNFGAEIFLDGKKIGGHDGPLMPFSVDLTGVAKPGQTQRLEVKAYHSRHYNIDGLCQVPVGFDYEYWRGMHSATWTSKTAYGITKYVRLTSLPPQSVHTSSIHTSVTKGTLGFEATLVNVGDQPVTLELTAELSSWNQADWKYPAIPAQTVTIPAQGQTKAVFSDIPWALGEKSFWWPNLPFREDYRAQLHLLHLTLKQDGRTVSSETRRFGFVEHAEGPYYYTVNGVRVTGFSDATAEAQLSEFDAYAELPAYQTADACRETWKRFMRLGLNSNRIHQSTPTDLMLDTADEVGFMLIPETALRGCHNQGWNMDLFPQVEREMIAHAQTHPSVARYSLMNEMPYDKKLWATLIDAAFDANPDRPLVIEDNNLGNSLPLKPTRVEGARGHAYLMAHYHYFTYPEECRGIFGMGETDWGAGLLPAYATHIREFRRNDVAYFATWSLLNYWPNLLEGGSYAKHAYKQSTDHDRTDGVDGWNSPIIAFLQRSQHPYLVQDLGLLAENPGPPHALGGGKIAWPYQLPALLSGKPTERQIEVFNGGLFGNRLTLAWSAHWDQPDGPVVEGAGLQGETACDIEPGFHATKTLSFTAPSIPKDTTRNLFLVLESKKDGQVVFRSEETCFLVLTRSVEPFASFLGADGKAQGDWSGKYGADGHELVGHESQFPAQVNLKWEKGDEWVYDQATDAPNALAYFANPPTGKDRIAAGRYGDKEITFSLDVGQTPRRLTLYCLDYDRKGRKESVELLDAITGKSLDRQTVEDFVGGKYLSWTVRGRVRVVVRKIAGVNAMVSGIFLDPAAKDADQPGTSSTRIK
jgi:hypothetical protein